jgi:hypothetical protein
MSVAPREMGGAAPSYLFPPNCPQFIFEQGHGGRFLGHGAHCVDPVIAFRIGAEDASYFVREFVDDVEPIDLLQLPNHRIYLELMIDGMPSKPSQRGYLPRPARLT